MTEVLRPGLEFAFGARGTLDPTVVIGETPGGVRRMVPITGGDFEGPNIRGKLVGGGADWQTLRADGVTVPEARYLLLTDDGVYIEVYNVGLRHGPPAVIARLAAGEPVAPTEYYFRSTPRFAVPAGRYEWLNRYVFICAGARYADHVRLWFYRVT
jgi:hypothetical protein